jgi:hypothetical protein
MSSHARHVALTSSLLMALGIIAHTATRAPVIWDDRALADWATPVGKVQIRPAHYSSAEYYAAPAENLRTYPVYRPDKEPPGYWESLQKKKPESLVDVSRMRTRRDWIAAGERGFREIDTPLARTDDPALLAMARDPATFADVPGLADGSVLEPRWVITNSGVMLTTLECGSCHIAVAADRTAEYAMPLGSNPQGVGPIAPRPLVAQLRQRGNRQAFGAVGLPATLRRQFFVPWVADEPMERFLTSSPQEVINSFFNPHGVIPRPNGSPLYGTRVPDLHTLRYSRYIDATGTHRLRGPEDVARYAALITGTDPFEFGPHHFLSDTQRRVRYRYADEVLYAIGVYLLSLEPPKNPNPPPADLVKRGKDVFRREKCGACHPAPTYTTGELTPALGFDVPFDHPNFGDVRDRSVGTDPGLALRTRKGTGFYKIPSLRGLWYRPRLLHDASIVTLEELFDPARLDPEYERKGWSPPGVTNGAVRGLEFLTKLGPDDRRALIAFLRSL